jgi:hypothetical protein
MTMTAQVPQLPPAKPDRRRLCANAFRSLLAALCGGFVAAAATGRVAAGAEAFERLAVASHIKSMTTPCMSRLEDGRLFLVWTTGGDAVVGAFSTNGRTWSTPVTLIATATGHDFDPSIVVSGKRILVTSTNANFSQGIHASTTNCVRSDDNGRTWCPRYEIPMNHRYSCGKCHQGIRLRSGTLLMGYSWDVKCEQGQALQGEGAMQLLAGVMISTDNGLTWTNGGDTDAKYRHISEGAVSGTDEPAIVELDDGSIYMLMRTGTDHLYQARSTDRGKTWTGIGPSPLRGSNAPAALCRFQAGPRRGILCVWDNAMERFPLCAAVSFDAGKTWSKPKDIAGPTGGRQASYPSCDQAADGTLVAVWQQDAPSGWDVRCARFSLDWLLENQGHQP